MAIRQRNFIIPREQQSIDRQQALAQALMTPQGVPQEWAGQRVTPQYGLGHGLTALASALAGGYVAKKANEQQRDFDEQTRIGNEGIIHDLTRDPRPQKLDAAGQGIPGTEPQDLLDIDTGRPELNTSGKAMELALSGMNPQQVQQALAQIYLQRSTPVPSEPYTLSPGQSRFDGGRVVASVADKPELTFEQRLQLAQAGASPTSVNVNTEKGLYGGLASARAKQVGDLYEQAQKAPDLLTRASRVKTLLGPDNQAITGAGANWLLQGAKVAAQLGFNTGNAAADTEALARDLSASTLDMIKSSGLGGGTGFSNADRDFLERVVGGKITLERKTLQTIADLNERAARKTIDRWNVEAKRLQPDQLRTLGMAPIEAPSAPTASGSGKLSRAPDGSWVYTP